MSCPEVATHCLDITATAIVAYATEVMLSKPSDVQVQGVSTLLADAVVVWPFDNDMAQCKLDMGTFIVSNGHSSKLQAAEQATWALALDPGNLCVIVRGVILHFQCPSFSERF